MSEKGEIWTVRVNSGSTNRFWYHTTIRGRLADPSPAVGPHDWLIRGSCGSVTEGHPVSSNSSIPKAKSRSILPVE